VELLEMGSEERVQGKSRKESREVKGHARRRRTEMREAEDVDEGGVKGTGRSGEDNGGMGGRREKKEDEKERNSLKAEELTLHAAARRTAHREADKRTNFLLRASLSDLTETMWRQVLVEPPAHRVGVIMQTFANQNT